MWNMKILLARLAKGPLVPHRTRGAVDRPAQKVNHTNKQYQALFV